MIKHIVMWKLKEFAEGADKNENAQKLKLQIESLKKKIKGIKYIEAGINFNDSDSAYDIVLYSEFQDLESLASYQQHPEHVKVKNFVMQIASEGVMADYK